MKIIKAFFSCLLLSACASTESRSEIADRFKAAQNMETAAKLKECEAIATEYPEDAYGMYCAGFIAEEQKKDTATAKRQYSQAISADPNLEQAYVARGYIFAAENKQLDAARDYDKASQLNRAEPNHALMAGWMYSLGQDWSSAIPKLKAYLDAAGNSNQEKFLTASVYETVARLNWFNIRMKKAKNKTMQMVLLTEAMSPDEDFCGKFEKLNEFAQEIKKDSDLAPAYEFMKKEMPNNLLCKFKANLKKDSRNSRRR